jgi:hypothetical protein
MLSSFTNRLYVVFYFWLQLLFLIFYREYYSAMTIRCAWVIVLLLAASGIRNIVRDLVCLVMYMNSFFKIKRTLFTAKADPVYTLQTLDSGYFNQGKASPLTSLHKVQYLQYTPIEYQMQCLSHRVHILL